jgi:RNA polymerase sigma factor (sigma-70 family)
MLTATQHPDLLTDYTRTRSSQALGQLIEQHIDFVYAAAFRQLKDSNLAEDVTQAVFIILTRKAGSIRPSSLVGWLYNTTRYCAKNARRGELRRRRHEQQAARREASMPNDFPSTDQSITDLREKLDDGLASLPGGDREVVLLRYLQGREFSDLSATLGISEQAAQKD